jgi:hypothetical protein
LAEKEFCKKRMKIAALLKWVNDEISNILLRECSNMVIA